MSRIFPFFVFIKAVSRKNQRIFSATTKYSRVLPVTTRKMCHTTCAHNMNVPKVIIDTDAGIDDALAIFMILAAHKRRELNVIAITTVQGNTSVDHVNVNVLRILHTVELVREIPVFVGAKSGLVHYYDYTECKYHGADGFGDAKHDFQPSLDDLQKEPAASALIRLVTEYKGQVTLAAIGPLTNVALAIRLDPNFADYLKDFYIMGGNVQGEGNQTPSAEFNFLADPEGAKVVLDEYPRVIKVVPWETCIHNVVLPFSVREDFGKLDTPVVKLMNKIEELVLTRATFKNWVNCDQLCAAWLVNDLTRANTEAVPLLVSETEELVATVETTGIHTRGQMVVDKMNRQHKKPNVLVMKNIKQSLFLKYLRMAFTGDFSYY